jgi:uncharacterized protein
MAVDHIRYDLLAQEALLEGVVRRVLADAARNGLPGDHHFFITFDTRTAGVRMSARLHAQHPAELTIVLQHQFWDLTVTEEAFEVGLSFGGVPEQVVVPLRAIKGFFDPSVEFGMRFEMESGSSDPSLGTTDNPARSMRPSAAPAQPGAPVPALSVGTAPAAPPDAAEVNESEPRAETPGGRSQGGEVVRIDRFRKK